VAGIVGITPPRASRLVTFGAYRVFGCAGSTTDIMIAAMGALWPTACMLNMSIGSFQCAYPTAQAPTGW
jgi:hypothetical protein